MGELPNDDARVHVVIGTLVVVGVGDMTWRWVAPLVNIFIS